MTKEEVIKIAEWTSWSHVSAKIRLPESLMREFNDKLDWDYISICQRLSEDFMKEFRDRVNWKYISIYQKLSEDFMREFKDKLGWGYIGEHQKLSENFLREFKDKLDWEAIAQYQELSDGFVKEFNLDNYEKRKVVHYCGEHNMAIYRILSEPDTIHIRSFMGTENEVKEIITKEYEGADRDDYIAKVEECFSN